MWRRRASPSLSTSGSRTGRRFPTTQRPASSSSTPHTRSVQKQELWLVCVRMCLDKDTHGRQGRGSRDGGLTPRGGGRYFGETVDGARGLEPRGESAVLVCTFLNSRSLSVTARSAQRLASNTSCQPSCWPLRCDTAKHTTVFLHVKLQR